MGAGASHGKVTKPWPFTHGQALFFEIGTPKNSPDVCRRLTLSRNSANFHASLLDAPSRKQAFSPAPPDRPGPFLRSFLFPKAPEVPPGQFPEIRVVNGLPARIAHERDSAWRRRAFGAVPLMPTSNFLKILIFIFT